MQVVAGGRDVLLHVSVAWYAYVSDQDENTAGGRRQYYTAKNKFLIALPTDTHKPTARTPTVGTVWCRFLSGFGGSVRFGCLLWTMSGFWLCKGSWLLSDTRL